MREPATTTRSQRPLRSIPSSLASVFAVVAVAGTLLGAPVDQPRDLPPADRDALADRSCRPERRVGASARASAADGEPISYRQEPAVLFANHAGPVGLSEVVVAGDLDQVRFRLHNPFGDDTVESWRRVGTATVGGRLVSVFQASWPEAVFASILSRASVGPDYPFLYWGTILEPGGETGVPVYLRVASAGLPSSVITRIDDSAQFASHVVNLVIPDFANGYAGVEDLRAAEMTAARRFYEHFADAYEVLSFVSEPSIVLDGYAAYHRNVQNRVSGINQEFFDRSVLYGSAGALHGVEVFRGPQAISPELSLHEMSHQWGHYFDWLKLAGLARVWPDDVHAPATCPGHSVIGAHLPGRWEARPAEGGCRLARTPAPIEAGPFELYAMGLLAAEDLPDLEVFLDQEQFADGRTPVADGSPVTGETKAVTYRDLLGVHGRREGPRPAVWRRALVVVSRDGLLGQREMDYWNFHSARLEDPNGASPMSYEGYVSLDRASRRQTDLRTRIEPRAQPALPQAFDVDYPPIAPEDCRGVRFSGPVARRYAVGERARLGGTVTASDRSDFSTVLVRFWPYGGDARKVVREEAEVSRGGDFRLEVEFRDGQEGQFLFEVFLFWPDAGAQYSRCTLSPVTVEARPSPQAAPAP